MKSTVQITWLIGKEEEVRFATTRFQADTLGTLHIRKFRYPHLKFFRRHFRSACIEILFVCIRYSSLVYCPRFVTNSRVTIKPTARRFMLKLGAAAAAKEPPCLKDSFCLPHDRRFKRFYPLPYLLDKN